MKPTSNATSLLSTLALCLLTALGGLAGLASCKSSPDGPIKPEVEDWETLLNQSIDAIEQEMITRLGEGASRRRILAYTGLENRGGHPMYDFQEYANATIQTRLQNSRLFDVIDQRVIESGMRAARIEIAADIQHIAKVREAFLANLYNQDAYPEYLMYARYTSLGAGDRDAKSIRMQLTFTLCDKESGEALVEKNASIKVDR